MQTIDNNWMDEQDSLMEPTRENQDTLPKLWEMNQALQSENKKLRMQIQYLSKLNEVCQQWLNWAGAGAQNTNPQPLPPLAAPGLINPSAGSVMVSLSLTDLSSNLFSTPTPLCPNPTETPVSQILLKEGCPIADLPGFMLTETFAHNRTWIKTRSIPCLTGHKSAAPLLPAQNWLAAPFGFPSLCAMLSILSDHLSGRRSLSAHSHNI